MAERVAHLAMASEKLVRGFADALAAGLLR